MSKEIKEELKQPIYTTRSQGARVESETNLSILSIVCISASHRNPKLFQNLTQTHPNREREKAGDMSDTISFEMGSVDRPNRFQVNPVNHQKNNNDTENRKSHAPSANETDASDSNGPHKVYSRLTNSEGELLEDDTFDATQLLKQQQQPRQQR